MPSARRRLRHARHQCRLRAGRHRAGALAAADGNAGRYRRAPHRRRERAALAPLADARRRLVPGRAAADLGRPSTSVTQRASLHAEAPFTKGDKPAFHTPLDNFSKLRLWQLTEYERCVFIDADALVLKNGRPAVRLSRILRRAQCLRNAGGFSPAELRRLRRTALRGDVRRHAGAAGPARGVLAAHRSDLPAKPSFPDWHGLPVFFNMLQYVWFNLPELWDWSRSSVVHYQYEKPWQTDHPKARSSGR